MAIEHGYAAATGSEARRLVAWDDPSRQSQINAECERLDKLAAHLGEVVERLTMRLGDVLTPSPPKAEGNARGPQPMLVPLAARLYEAGNRVEASTAMLADVLARLEV